MRTRNAPETRRRILEAATEDFARYGIAGARVDRIAERAGANKAQIYAYFGDKLSLFTVVFRGQADAVVGRAPFDVRDLPAYAVNLYDAARERPDVVRLLAWARLEGVELPLDPDGVREKLDAIAAEQAEGRLAGDATPEDVLAMVTATALSWTILGMSPVTDVEDHAARREGLRRAVANAFTASSSS